MRASGFECGAMPVEEEPAVFVPRADVDRAGVAVEWLAPKAAFVVDAARNEGGRRRESTDNEVGDVVAGERQFAGASARKVLGAIEVSAERINVAKVCVKEALELLGVT